MLKVSEGRFAVLAVEAIGWLAGSWLSELSESFMLVWFIWFENKYLQKPNHFNPVTIF